MYILDLITKSHAVLTHCTPEKDRMDEKSPKDENDGVELDKQEYHDKSVTNDKKSENSGLPIKSSNKTSILKCFALTASLGGAQFSFTSILSYGRPQLQSIGFSDEASICMLLLVPMCGLVCQPVIGSYSDKYGSILGSRTPFLIVVCFITSISSLMFSWDTQIATLLVPGSDPENTTGMTSLISKLIVVLGIVGSGISQDINNACSRSLMVDKVPFNQQSLANAMAGISSALGSLFSYAVCAMDLPELLGTKKYNQLQLISIITATTTSISIIITIIAAKEGPTKKETVGKWYDPLKVIYYTFKELPSPIRTVCNIQFFSSLPWYPILFFSSIWVEENTLSVETLPGIDSDLNENISNARQASIPLVIFSLSSLISGLIMPAIIPLRYPRNPGKSSLKYYFYKLYCMLVYTASSTPKVWAISHVLLFIVLCFTPIRMNLYSCLIVMTIVGYTWGIVQWVPFAIISELLIKLRDEKSNILENIDIMTELPGKHDNIIVKSADSFNKITVDNGAILGVHNVYVVVPQLLSAIISLGVTHYVESNYRSTGVVSAGWCMLACSFGAPVAAYLILKNIPRLNYRYDLFKNESHFDSSPVYAHIVPCRKMIDKANRYVH